MKGLQKMYAEDGVKGYFRGCLTNCYK